MTNDQEKRILDSIAECDRYIEKEEKRDPELRKYFPEVVKTLAYYKAHKQKLVDMLAAA